MTAALFNKYYVAVTTFAAFEPGLLLGEPLGQMWLTPWEEANGMHYGWAIWLCIFLGGLVLGILLQAISGNFKRREKAP